MIYNNALSNASWPWKTFTWLINSLFSVIFGLRNLNFIKWRAKLQGRQHIEIAKIQSYTSGYFQKSFFQSHFSIKIGTKHSWCWEFSGPHLSRRRENYKIIFKKLRPFKNLFFLEPLGQFHIDIVHVFLVWIGLIRWPLMVLTIKEGKINWYLFRKTCPKTHSRHKAYYW